MQGTKYKTISIIKIVLLIITGDGQTALSLCIYYTLMDLLMYLLDNGRITLTCKLDIMHKSLVTNSIMSLKMLTNESLNKVSSYV